MTEASTTPKASQLLAGRWGDDPAAFDARLLGLLYENGRLSTRELARRMDQKVGRVRSRLTELREAGLLRVIPLVDFESAGFQFSLMIFIQVEGRDPEAVGRDLAEHELIVSVTMILGRYDLAVRAMAREKPELVDLMHHINQIPGIRSLDTTMSLDVARFDIHTLDLSLPMNVDSFLPIRTLDERDNQIVACLWRDGRMTNYEISREVGVTEGAIRRRIQQLVDNRIIRIAGIADSRLSRARYYATIGLWVDRLHIDKVIDHLRQIDGLVFVASTLGMYDVTISVYSSGREQILDTLTNRVRAVPHVRRAESMEMIKVLKFNYSYIRILPEARAALPAMLKESG